MYVCRASVDGCFAVTVSRVKGARGASVEERRHEGSDKSRVLFVRPTTDNYGNTKDAE